MKSSIDHITTQAMRESSPPTPRFATQRFSRRGTIATLAICVILLLPTLFYSLDADISLFFIGARKILNGGLYYRDVVDVKPPLIYYIYAAAIALFGDDQISIRLLDLILQGTTCALIFALIRRAATDDLWGAAAAVGYAVIYTSGAGSGTIQAESYLPLLSVGMLHLLLARETIIRPIAIGILAGVAVLLKATFGALLAVAVLAEIVTLAHPWRRMLRDTILMACGTAFVIALFFLYLQLSGTYGSFQLVQRFTSGYARLGWEHPGEILRGGTTALLYYFGNFYTLLMMAATGIGIYRSAFPAASAGRGTQLLQCATLGFLGMIGTIAIEGKFAPYQFGRIHGFAAVLAGFGLVGILRSATARHHHGPYTRLAAVIILPLALLFSPLPRYLWFAGISVRQELANLRDGTAEHRGENIPTVAEAGITGRFILNAWRDGDQVFAAANACGMVYYTARTLPEHPLYFFAAFVSPFAPMQWKDSIRADLLGSPPRFLVLQINDSIPGVTGSPLSSAQTLRALPGIDSLLNVRYDLALRGSIFEVYRRR
ncbi:MAG: glycosyltransferase family 39 protein [Bacteroidota bacterium]